MFKVIAILKNNNGEHFAEFEDYSDALSAYYNTIFSGMEVEDTDSLDRSFYFPAAFERIDLEEIIEESPIET